MIYFDSAASYPILDETRSVLIDSFRTLYGNSSSIHALGQKESEHIEDARRYLSELIDAYPSEIVFTSSATESNNLALKSIIPNPKKHIITAQSEHKCILSITQYLAKLGFDVTYVKPNFDGIITADVIKSEIRKDTALISIMHVNNELGTINDIKGIGQLCLDNQILFHCDAAQSLCKVTIDVDELNVDMMSFSAHKIGGPKGIGALYIRDCRTKNIEPVIHGAGQEQGIRGGTVATPLISGFLASLKNFPNYYEKVQLENIKNQLVSRLIEEKVPYQINGCNTVNHIISLTLMNTNIETLIQENEQLFCLAQGSACSSKEIEPSHVLMALGLTTELAHKTLRISFHHQITQNDVNILINAIKIHTS